MLPFFCNLLKQIKLYVCMYVCMYPESENTLPIKYQFKYTSPGTNVMCIVLRSVTA